jgi:hypothetical protein
MARCAEASADSNVTSFVSGSGGGGLEGQCDAVHAIAQARWLRPIVEHMPEVTAATMAMDSGPDHEETGVLGLANSVIERCPEARPAGAAIELGG